MDLRINFDWLIRLFRRAVCLKYRATFLDLPRFVAGAATFKIFLQVGWTEAGQVSVDTVRLVRPFTCGPVVCERCRFSGTGYPYVGFGRFFSLSGRELKP